MTHSDPSRALRGSYPLAVGCALALAACTSASAPAGQAAGGAQAQRQMESSMQPIVLGAQPATVKVKKGADAAAALAAGKPVLVRLQGIGAPADRSAIVRLFVGAGADAATPVADPRFVGLVTLVARPQAQPANAVVEVPAAARALIDKAGDEVSLSLVPVSADGSAAPAIAVTIESITVSAQ